MINPNPFDYSTGGLRTRAPLSMRSPNDPDSGAPDGWRGAALWVLGIFLIGVLPAGALIYWGYVAPLTAWCGLSMMGTEQVCDYSFRFIHHHYTYTQALSDEVFKQQIDRVIGVVWALLTLRYVVRWLRERAVMRAQAETEPLGGVPLGGAPHEGRAAYRLDRILSTLSTVGIVLCALGVLVLLILPPEIFPL